MLLDITQSKLANLQEDITVVSSTSNLQNQTWVQHAKCENGNHSFISVLTSHMQTQANKFLYIFLSIR